MRSSGSTCSLGAQARLLSAMLLLATTFPVVAQSTRIPEWRTDEVGQQMVADASRGAVYSAFALAQELRNQRDEEFGMRLNEQRDAVVIEMAQLGGPTGPVFRVRESHFGTSVTREYRVKFARGEQAWKLRFRRGSRGWQLAALSVDTLPPSRSLIERISTATDPEPQ